MGDDLINKNLLPSERAATKEREDKEREDRALRSLEALRSDFKKTFQTDHGKRTLAWIYRRSGFGKVLTSADPREGKIDTLLTTLSAQEYNFYIAIRNILPRDLIQEIEDERYTRPAGTLDDTDDEQPITRTSSTGGKRTRKPRR